jgi:predicted nucleic acid-binding protein
VIRANVRRVLDSWAILAWLRSERAAPRVRALLLKADAGTLELRMSWINVGEIYYTLVRKTSASSAEEFIQRLPSLPIGLVVPDERDIIAAAKLKSTRKISYADGFAAALAQREAATLVTGDPKLRAMSDILKIDWLGK